MKLLIWVLAMAIIGVLQSNKGFGPQDAVGMGDLLRDFGIFGAIYLFVGGGIPVIIMRFKKGWFDWVEVRLIAKVFALEYVLFVFVSWIPFGIYQGAGNLLGGWPAGWDAAVVGAGVGSVVGFLERLLFVWLRIPDLYRRLQKERKHMLSCP